MNYEDKRNFRLEKEIFFRISPNYPQSQSISLVLSGEISSTASVPGEHDFKVDLNSIENQIFTVRGMGFPLETYEDTLRHCYEVWFPIQAGDEVRDIRFKVQNRTSYRNWIYLWNYEENNKAKISGSWIVDGFVLEEEPYWDNPKELDYYCGIQGPEKSVIFVTYEPKNFRYNGTYNATLNNAISESRSDTFTVISGSERYKNYRDDYHKVQEIGGHGSGEIRIDQGTDSRYIRTVDFRKQFDSRAEKYGGNEGLQVLDLAYMSFRAISASVYVDRFSGPNSASIDSVWEDLQQGNEDDSETIYFIPQCSNVSGNVGINKAASIPSVGDLVFKLEDSTNPVRFVEATLYAPFLNRVYRTDKFGAITEEFPRSDFYPEDSE